MVASTIITVLSNIPWGQVVDNAPKVADGATKLWNAVTNRKSTSDHTHHTEIVIETTSTDLEALRNHIITMEGNLSDLQNQMRDSTQLIKELALQNAQLVQKIELNSIRLRQLAIATATSLAILAGGIIYLLV